MMKKILIISGVLALFSLNSCNTEDLSLSPDGKELDATFYKTDEQIISALYGAYDPFQWVIWGGSTFLWGSITSDDAIAGGSGPLDQSGFQICDRFTADPNEGTNADLLQYYQLWWAMNARANTILQYANKESTLGKKAIANAYFLKGMAYYQLIKMFGGLPIINKPDDNMSSRASVEDTWLACEGYLRTAIESGNLEVRNGFNEPKSGFATKGAAQALLGKVLIYEKKYADAVTVFETIKGEGHYKLEPKFDDVFWPGNKHGIESIFEINFAKNGNWDGQINNGNAICTLIGPRCDSNPIKIPNTNLQSGWGLNQPTQKLVDAFDAMGDTLRKRCTIISSDSIEKVAQKTYVWQNAITGFWDFKHIARQEYFTDATSVSQNTIVLRYADVLLLLAEAYNKTGDDGKAKENLKLVRERAKLGVTDIDAASGSALMTLIKKERQLEFALEGERYFDLVRWGDAATELKAEAYDAGGLDYTTGKPGVETNGLFPIPYATMSHHGSDGFTQNPGYPAY